MSHDPIESKIDALGYGYHVIDSWFCPMGAGHRCRWACLVLKLSVRLTHAPLNMVES